MTQAAEAATVTSRDGTPIAYWRSGAGPPLVLVHGAAGDHTRWQPLLPYLEPHATVYAMDRRGRGGSGDGPDYDLAREEDDVAAVVAAVAQASGSPVDLYGHSYGGLCAFGAATLTSHLRRLVLYEGWPPVDPDAHALPPVVEQQMDTLLAAGEREAALELLLREVVGAAEPEIAELRGQPSWPARVAAAARLTREIRTITEATFDPAVAARITVPVLLLVGSDSTDPAAADVDQLAAALPAAQVAVLAGHGHLADVLAPAVTARQLLSFLRPDG